MNPSVRRRAAVLAGFDPAMAAHVATAMTGYQRALSGVGREVPDEFRELRSALELLAATSGQSVDRGARGCEDEPAMTSSGRTGQHLALGYRDAAVLVGVSERSLRRHVASGRLPATRVGRRVLIDPVDLHDLIRRGA